MITRSPLPARCAAAPLIWMQPDPLLPRRAYVVRRAVLDTAGTGAWSKGPTRRFGSRSEGSAVMYDDGKVLLMGGGATPTNTAEIVDLGAASPAWQWTGPMRFARRHMNATLLPDGTVLAGPACMEQSGFIEPITLPTTGTYSVLVDPVQFAVGSVTL